VQWIKTIAGELFGLIVDDGTFAVAIIVWLGAVGLLSRQFLQDAEWTGPVLFAGLGAILLHSTIYRSRR
jgi:hypothetical protein